VRLLVGKGNFPHMSDATTRLWPVVIPEIVTVSLRRADLPANMIPSRSILDFIDREKFLLLPTRRRPRGP